MRLFVVHHLAQHYGVAQPAATRINDHGGGIDAKVKLQQRQASRKAAKAARKLKLKGANHG